MNIYERERDLRGEERRKEVDRSTLVHESLGCDSEDEAVNGWKKEGRRRECLKRSYDVFFRVG